MLYLLILAFVLWWLTAHTPVGRYLYAIGGNTGGRAPVGRAHQALHARFALVTSATISGLAGVMFSSLNGPSLNFGGTLLLPAFAAAFLGSTQLIPGRFNVWGTLLAIYVLATGVQGLQLVSGASWLSDMFNGVRADHRRRAVDQARALALWSADQGAVPRRLRSPSPDLEEPDLEAEIAAESPPGRRLQRRLPSWLQARLKTATRR